MGKGKPSAQFPSPSGGGVQGAGEGGALGRSGCVRELSTLFSPPPRSQPNTLSPSPSPRGRGGSLGLYLRRKRSIFLKISVKKLSFCAAGIRAIPLPHGGRVPEGRERVARVCEVVAGANTLPWFLNHHAPELAALSPSPSPRGRGGNNAKSLLRATKCF